MYRKYVASNESSGIRRTGEGTGQGGGKGSSFSQEHGEDKEEASVNNKSRGEGLSRANLVMVMNRSG